MVHFESGWFGGAIGQDHRRIIQEYRVPHCRLDADTRRASCEYQAPNPILFQDVIQACLMEATEPVLVENDIAGLRLQFVEDLGVPCVADEDSTRNAIRGGDGLTNTSLQMADSVGSVGSAKVRKIRAIGHLEIDDRYPRAARSRQSPRRRWNDSPNLRNAHSKAIQQAAF